MTDISKRVLIVDDLQINRFILKSLVSRLGFASEEATSGEDAVTCVQQGKYDVIFMDVHMPKLDGVQASKEIRLFDTKTPIIIVSADNSYKTISDCFEIGIQGYLVKPLSYNQLKTVLRQIS